MSRGLAEMGREPTSPPPSTAPARFQLRHLLAGVAVLGLLVGSAIQVFVIQRRSWLRVRREPTPSRGKRLLPRLAIW